MGQPPHLDAAAGHPEFLIFSQNRTYVSVPDGDSHRPGQVHDDHWGVGLEQQAAPAAVAQYGEVRTYQSMSRCANVAPKLGNLLAGGPSHIC